MSNVDFIAVLTSNLDSAPQKTPSLVYHMSHLDEKRYFLVFRFDYIIPEISNRDFSKTAA